MGYLQDPKFNGKATLYRTPEEWEAMQRKKQEESRHRYQNNPLAAATKLYQIARTDTGGGRAASALLLSLWNDEYAANLRDVISSLDIDNTEAAIALLSTLGPGHHLERYLTQEQIIEIIEVWGTTHERARVYR